MSKATIMNNIAAKRASAKVEDAMYLSTEYKEALNVFLDTEFNEEYLTALKGKMLVSYEETVIFTEEVRVELMEIPWAKVVLEMEPTERKKYMHSDDFKQDVPDGALRGSLWNFPRMEDRRDILAMFLDKQYNKKKLSFRIKGMVRTIAQAVIESGKESIVANALLDRLAKFMPNEIDGVKVEATTRDNMVMTVLELMKKLGYINIETIQDKRTKAWNHMVSSVFAEEFKIVSLYESYRAVNGRRALLSEPKDVVSTDKLVSTGSWYYKSPELSKEVLEFVNIQNKTRLGIVNDYSAFEKAIVRKYYNEEDAETMSISQMEPWMRQRAVLFAKELDDINKYGGFYVTHFFESKFRSFEKSELFGVQQNSTARALVELGNKEALTDAGRMALKLDIAAKAGFDKCTMEEALEAFSKYESEWRGNRDFPREFAVLDMEDETGFIVYSDATNSGTQMYAVATGSKQLARIAGMIDGERFDAYQMLADAMNKALGVTCFTRKKLKYTFMTKLYNAGKTLILHGEVKDEADMNALERMENFGGIKKSSIEPLQITLANAGHILEDDQVWGAFDKVMSELAPMALIMMDAIGEIDDRELYTWIMKDGAVCQSARYTVVEEDVLWSDEFGHRRHFIHRRKVASKTDKKAALAPGIIHAMDSYALRETVRRLDAMGIASVTIHDSFGVHPNNVFSAQQVYREVLADMLDQDIMSNILNQLLDKEYCVQNIVQDNDKLTREDILASKYALWM